MISILLLSIILVVIAAVLLYQAKKALDYTVAVLENKSASLDTKNQICLSAYNDLEQAQFRFQQLNNKLSNELEFWKKRRTMLPKVPKNTRKEKVRGKRRKGRK
jgi:hypothetical protein